ncbi:MAG TPA: hypothetical protein VMG81_00600 [Thermoplasmata archaeon]|nr:hypothetical protein [Thermoplasmata archaeon]
MAATEKVYVRYAAVLGVVIAVSLVAGGLAWPSNAVPSPLAPVLVRISEVAWNVSGCPAVGNATEPGAVLVSGAAFTVDRNVSLPASAPACAVDRLTVGPAGFLVENASTPTAVPGGLVTWSVTVLAPAGYLTSSLTVQIGASSGG